MCSILALAAVLPGCFGPALPGVACGEGNICPDGLVCRLSDRACVAPEADAAVDPDGGLPDPDAADAAPLPPLVDRGLLVRYFIDEAVSGTAPNMLIDSAGDPQPLVLGYLGNMAFETDADGNSGLTWNEAGGAGAAGTIIDGTKLEQIDGARRLTYELVVRVQGVSAGQGYLIHVGDADEDATLVQGSGGVQVVYSDGNDTVTWSTLLNQRRVVHAVYDGTINPASARLRLYVDGALVSNPSGDFPSALPVSVNGGASLVIGNNVANDRSIAGRIAYAAIYTAAFDPTEVTANATRLLLSDDRQ